MHPQDDPPSQSTADTVWESFRQHAVEEPYAVALCADSGRFTYGDLRSKVESLGKELTHRRSDAPVGLLMENKAAKVVGMFAALSANRGFVPLDPAYPNDRLLHMLEDSACDTLICLAQHYDQAVSITKKRRIVSRIFILDTEFPFDLAETIGSSESAPQKDDAHSFNDDLAYIVYTSGTTGSPKGVPITNANLMPLMFWQREHFDLGKDTRTVSTLAFTFDFGIQEIFTTLMFGGTLYVPEPPTLRDPERFHSYLLKHQITMLYAVPSFMEAICLTGELMKSLRVILLGGERLYWKLVDELTPLLKSDCKIFNGYGPTEATINNAMYLVNDSDPRQGDSVPIGKASGQSQLFLLNEQQQPVAKGDPGELFIGGPGLSQGYLNQPTLTSTYFRSIDINGSTPLRLYKTGDRVKELPDGNFEFLGRFDNQIKFNGFRIELEDIEATLTKYPGIQSAAASLEIDDDGIQQLVAYVVSTDTQIVSSEVIRHAERQLPGHMVPSSIWRLDQMPLTQNGKIDRDRLQPPNDIPKGPPNREPINNWFYKTVWQPAESPSEQSLQSAPLSDILEVDLRQPSSIAEAMVALGDQTKLPPIILAYDLPPDDAPLYKSFLNLLKLLEVIGRRAVNAPIALGTVTRQAYAVETNETVNPAGALLTGIGKVLPFELPSVKWVHIDLDDSNKQPSQRELLDQLNHLESGSLIAYRKGQPLVWDIVQTRIPPAKDRPLRSGGTYLITGGLGAIGRVLAEGIAKERDVNFVLLDIPAFVEAFDPSELDHLKAQGCGVHIVGCDICNLEQLSQSLNDIRQRFGNIFGLVHTAGQVHTTILQNLTEESARKVLDPKVIGTQNLAEALAQDPLDFVVLCSSIDAIRGNFSQAAYCAANAYLDSFAHAMRQQGKPYTSINWDLWSEVGMAARTEVADDLKEARKEALALGISSTEGIELFFRCLAAEQAQVAISTIPLKPRIGQLGWTWQSPNTAKEQAVAEPTPEEDSLQSVVLEVFKTVLKNPDLEIDDNFFHNGGDSLAAIRIVAGLKKQLGKKVPIRNIFKAPTVRKMADLLEGS